MNAKTHGHLNIQVLYGKIGCSYKSEYIISTLMDNTSTTNGTTAMDMDGMEWMFD